MNLTGKYIEIDKNNAKYIITLLYSKNFSWTLSGNLVDTLNSYHSFININNKKSYINFISSNTFIFLLYKPLGCNYFDINKLLREYKLKRILKTKYLLK